MYRFNASQWFCTYPIAPPSGLLGSTSGFCASSHFSKLSRTGTARSWRTRSRIAARADSSASGGSSAISALIALLDGVELAVIGQGRGRPRRIRRLRLDELAPRMRIATHLHDVAAGVDAVVAAEGVGLQVTRENP